MMNSTCPINCKLNVINVLIFRFRNIINPDIKSVLLGHNIRGFYISVSYHNEIKNELIKYLDELSSEVKQLLPCDIFNPTYMLDYKSDLFINLEIHTLRLLITDLFI
jgi:hypothetical protein